ncbi:MAG: hypothetical protein JNK87_38700 [Bryobacterales bacterium]|nr:hypothetical protein [Bryobacterales bacterium]
MLRSLPLLALLAATHAYAGWEEVRSGPFQVWFDGHEREARRLLVRLEQIRYMMGVWLGKSEPVTLWPIHVILLNEKNAKPLPVTLGRSTWLAALPYNAEPSPAWQADIVRKLLESNARLMPPHWESGLISFLSTLTADGPKLTLGTPPPTPERTLDWARFQYLATNPEYQSRFRVLMNNLQQGADEQVAYRNSLGATKAEIEKIVTTYFQAGNFPPATIAGRAMSEKDFYVRPLEPNTVAASLADLSGNPSRIAAGSLEAMEFQGLKGDATALQQAVANGSKSARVHLAHGRHLKDPKQKLDAYVQAAKLNPIWAEPYVEMANLEKTPARAAFYLKQAAPLDARNSALWQRLAKIQSEANEFNDAAKSWFAAELSAPTAKEKEAVRQARLQFEEERAEKEAAEKKRIADERQRELDRLREEAMNRVREAEAKANKGGTPVSGEVVPWWDEKQEMKKLSGTLDKVDCLKPAARLWIAAHGAKPVALLIPDPTKVVILSQNGEASFGCGVQKPARQVTVEYVPRPNAKLATSGDITRIEFR